MNNVQFNRSAVSASECLTVGWDLIKNNYLTFLLMVVLEIVIIFAVSLIPFIGGILSTALAAPLLVGIYMGLLKQYRGERADFGIMFEGFDRFLPAALVAVIGNLPLLLFGVAAVFFSSLSFGLGNIQPGNSEAMMRGLGATVILAAVVTYLLVIILQALLFFALPLIADRDMNAMDAVKLSISAATANIGGLILLFILEGIAIFVGALACCVGLLFVMPIVYAANIIAYRMVFPDANQPLGNQAPPQPDAYGGTYGMPQQ